MEKKFNYNGEGTLGNTRELIEEIFGEIEPINVKELSIKEIQEISKQNELIAMGLIELIIEALNNKKIPYDVKNFIYNRIESIQEKSEKIIKGA